LTTRDRQIASVSPIGFGQQPSISATFSPEAALVVHTGDTATFIKTIPDCAVQLIVTSPPYNIGKTYETQVELKHYLEFQNGIIEDLVRVLADKGSICWQVGNYVENGEIYPLDMFYYEMFKRHGLKLRNRIVWHFGHGLHASRRFSGRYEVLLWFTKSDQYVFNLDSVRVPSKYPGKTNYKGPNRGKPSGNPLGKNPSDVWEIVQQDWDEGVWNIPNVKSNHPEKTAHPCQFPVELVQRCVLALTSQGDWVFDPYMGAGSSLIAAAMHGRRAMGCDKEPEYTSIAIDRLGKFYSGNLKLRPIGTPVYQPTGKEKVSQIPFQWLKS
jgi:adenine-specific DNA-methyltransferase